MNHKRSMLLLAILSSVLLAGCWDSAELQKLNIISGIGIDKGSDEEENRYRTTVQIVNAPQVAGGQQGGKVQTSPVTVYTDSGSTLTESLRKITSKASGELFFPHVQLLVIGEEMAREGIQELFDVIERDSQFRVLFPVLIVRGDKAEDILKVTTSLEAIPSAKIVNTLEASKEGWGEYTEIRADQVIAGLKEGSLGITGVEINGDLKKGNAGTNVQQISPDARLEIRGFALFKDGKLKKWLDDDAARGITWINNEVKRTIVNLDCKNKRNGISVETTRSQTDVKARIKNNKPVIDITIRVEGDVSETLCQIDLGSNTEIEKLQKQMEREIKEEVLAAVKEAQEEKSDIFGFGEYVNIEDKRLWKKIKKNWGEEIFPVTEVNVKIQAYIRRTGMRMTPYLK